MQIIFDEFNPRPDYEEKVITVARYAYQGKTCMDDLFIDTLAELDRLKQVAKDLYEKHMEMSSG
jgi:hypothetical protein